MSVQAMQLLLLILAAGYAAMGIQVQVLHREARVNRLFLIICLSLSVWALGYAFMVTGTSLSHANGWRIVSALGWNTFYAHWLFFILCLTGVPPADRKRIALMIYLPAALFLVHTVLMTPGQVLEKTPLGWIDTNYVDPVDYLFTVYYVGVLAYSLYLLQKWRQSTPFERERRQARLIEIAVLSALILGGMTDSLLPMMGVQIFPMGIVFVGLSMGVIGYAILKYKLMSLSAFHISEHILKNVQVPILVVDSGNSVFYANQAAAELFEVAGPQALYGTAFEGKIRESHGKAYDLDRQTSRSGDEVHLTTIKGQILCCVMTLSLLRDEYADIIGKALLFGDISRIKEAEMIIGDYNRHLMDAADKRTQALIIFNEKLKEEVTERKRIEEQISKMLYHDEMTHLPNRLYFKEQVSKIISLYSAEKIKGLAILFMDLDDFKYINDSLGHYVGDELIKRVAVRLQEMVWGHYLVARNGGDEFLILVHDLEPSTARSIVEKLTSEIIEGFGRSFHVAGKDLYVTASVGTAFYPTDGHDFDTLVRHADMALFEAKLSGKNMAVLSSEEMVARIKRTADLRNRLFKALENNEFVLYYQPLVHMESRRIVGMEGLLRWKMDGGAYVSPSEFIPLAEETGLIVPIGEWVIEQAAHKIRSLHHQGYSNLVMAVNVSAHQLKQKDFVARTQAILERQGIGPGQLEFEITERVGLQELLEAEQVIDRLHALGVRIAIDDFGTDYSSFMTVRHLQIDKIKIAMEFVQGAHEDFKDAAIVRTIAGMASILNMKVTAEGVENSEQLAFLRQVACDEIQGCYFYRPMGSDQLDLVLAKEKIRTKV